MSKWTLPLVVLIGCTSFSTLGQKPVFNKDGLLIYLTNDSVSYIKFNFLIQLWSRYTVNNPGTTIENVPQDHTFDIGLRRVRFIMSGQLSPKTFFYVQYGQNGLSYLAARKTGAFFHDIMAEYHLLGKQLHIGGGLMGWNGVSRYANSAVGAILCLETPSLEEVTIDINDQLLRKLGIYAKGTIGKVDYRLSLAKPFVIQTAAPPPNPVSKNSTYSTNPPNPEWQTYIRYQFFEMESMVDPAAVGTYLGTKKVLNIGIGADYQKDGMFHLNNTDTVNSDLFLSGIDVFADLPLQTKGSALTLYLSYCHYNYGNGFLRNGGAMNPATGTIPSLASFNGPGNSYPLLGNGQAIYFQGGYFFKSKILGAVRGLQPYFDLTHGNYDRLSDPLNTWDIGMNWLLEGKRTKLTLDYQSRPLFYDTINDKAFHKGNKPQWVLQFQLAL